MNQKRLLITMLIVIVVILIGIVGYFIYSSYQPTISGITINDVRDIAINFCGKPYKDKLGDLPIKSVQLCGDKLLLSYSGGGTICSDCPYIILDANGQFLDECGGWVPCPDKYRKIIDGSSCHSYDFCTETNYLMRQQKCGDVVLDGYLVTDCPWQAYPSIPDYKSKEGMPCDLDVWLSESRSEGAKSEICRNVASARPPQPGQPLTSKCFLEKISSFDPWGPKLLDKFPKVTLIGRYEKIKVCHLLQKCLEPECSECKEEDVFVPCEMIEK